MLKLLFFIWLKPFDLIFYSLNGLKPISIEYDIQILNIDCFLNYFFSDPDHQNQN